MLQRGSDGNNVDPFADQRRDGQQTKNSGPHRMK
jgi:hypothetical protein